MPKFCTELKYRIKATRAWISQVQNGAPYLCSHCANIDWAFIMAQRSISHRSHDSEGFIDFFPWYNSRTSAGAHSCPLCALIHSLVRDGSGALRTCMQLADFVLLQTGRTQRGAPVIIPQSNDPLSPMVSILHPQSAEDQFVPCLIDAESVDYTTLRVWLRQCRNDHTKACVPTRSIPSLNFKVLDCASREAVEAGPDCSYVALSYVWGQYQDESDAGFPRTIEDAFIVSIKLGYEYICEYSTCLVTLFRVCGFSEHHENC
jgi:hypothetical protein